MYVPHALGEPMDEAIGRGATLPGTVLGPPAGALLMPNTARSSVAVEAPAGNHSARRATDQMPGSEVSSFQSGLGYGAQMRPVHLRQPWKKTRLRIPHDRLATRGMCESVANNLNFDKGPQVAAVSAVPSSTCVQRSAVGEATTRCPPTRRSRAVRSRTTCGQLGEWSSSRDRQLNTVNFT